MQVNDEDFNLKPKKNSNNTNNVNTNTNANIDSNRVNKISIILHIIFFYLKKLFQKKNFKYLLISIVLTTLAFPYQVGYYISYWVSNFINGLNAVFNF